MAIEYKITNTNTNETHYRYNQDSVQDLVEEITDDISEALIVSSWCEEANCGDTYQSEDYSLTVEICEI